MLGTSIENVYALLDDAGDTVKLVVEFDIYETCPLVHGTIALCLNKHSPHLGLEFYQDQGKKDEKIVVKSVQKGSISHR